MTLLDASSYFLTLVAIAIAPGPVALMLLVRSAGNDIRGAIGFGLGFVLGGIAIISAVCFGLSLWLTAVPEVFEYSKYVMLAYILWLARGIWKGGFDLSGTCDAPKTSLLASGMAGFLTCAISPYMMVLFPLVLPEMMDITQIVMPDFLLIAVATFLALGSGVALLIGFASQVRRLVNSPARAMYTNRVLSSVLVLGGSWMAFG